MSPSGRPGRTGCAFRGCGKPRASALGLCQGHAKQASRGRKLRPLCTCVECGAETRRWRNATRCGPCAKKRLQEQQRVSARKLDYRTRVYGITPPQVAAMLLRQGGRCGVCRARDPGPRGWHLDHDHRFAAKNPVGHRGLVCQPCNHVLGFAEDNPQTLRRAAEYLTTHRTRFDKETLRPWPDCACGLDATCAECAPGLARAEAEVDEWLREGGAR